MFFRNRRYGLFVSYRSLDADFAREVADKLISAGARVWFAEYEFLLPEWQALLRDNQSPKVREAFLEEILLSGARRSHFGLALTNREYMESSYCRLEMAELLDHCGPAKVLHLKIAEDAHPHAVFPALEGSPQSSASDVNEALSFVGLGTGWKLPTPPEGDGHVSSSSVAGTCIGRRYRLETTGWDVVEPGGEHFADSTKGPSLRKSGGDPPVFANLYAGRESAPQARRQDPGDDREMYEALVRYLPHHVGRFNARVVGVHLFFHQNLSQMAATYRMPRHLGGYWTRKTSVIIPHPETGEAAEFVFTFGFPGSFREYCGLAHEMDRLVKTLDWE